MPGGLPAITGKKLAKLLVKAGWRLERKANHGDAYSMDFGGGDVRVTIIPSRPKSLPPGTHHAILGPKQTGRGRQGFLALLKKYG